MDGTLWLILIKQITDRVVKEQNWLYAKTALPENFMFSLHYENKKQ